MTMQSSRIFVRGLPPKFTEEDVRKHFAKFPITDLKFFPHRRIGYIGYKTPENASSAVKYFNKSFIKLSKINVEIARPIADKELPKSRRQQKLERNTPKADEYIPPRIENDLKRKRDEAERDPKLKEFLDAYQPLSKNKLWANENVEENKETNDIFTTVALMEDECDEEYQTIAKKARVEPEVESVLQSNLEPHNDQFSATPKENGVNEELIDQAQYAPPIEQGAMSDAAWLRSRTNRLLDLVEDDKNPSSGVIKPEAHSMSDLSSEQKKTGDTMLKAKPQQTLVVNSNVPPGVDEEQTIRETGRLYLRNLHYEVKEDELRELFLKHGAVSDVHVPTKKADGKGKGFAFVQFEDPELAVEAYLDNDNTIFQGRLLHIIPANRMKDTKLNDFEISRLPLKKQKEIRRKQDSAKAVFNWNSLYMNADSVMSTVAARMGISKAELLDPTSSDAAIKQAHAETHIIQETKMYFAEHGVDLEAFQKSAKGDIALLIKNIPRDVTSNDLRALFEEYGTIVKLLMPPTGLTAIVEYSNTAEAKAAFTSLSYRKMKDSILYLEKAPKDLFKKDVVIPVSHTTIPNATEAKPSVTELLEDAVEPDVASSVTLYIRNLNFTTTTERLTDVFKVLAGFRSANVKTKVDPKRGVLSMGFGFAEFDNTTNAQSALRAIDGYDLEGHKLQIRVSHKGADVGEERRKEDAAKKATSSKIIIKNLPFEANKKDVRALFSPYGQIRSIRVPKKFDSSSRGFGFAEFTTNRDAQNAINALKNTHFLGRRLVLAIATAEADDPEKQLDKMQQKVGAQANKVALQRLTSGGRKKFNIIGNEDDDV